MADAPQTNNKPDKPTEAKKGYGRRPLWQWILLYVIIGGIIYYGIYYYYSHKSNSNSGGSNTTNSIY